MTARTVYRGGGSGTGTDADPTPEATAIAELADMLDDPETMGPALVLLSARSCSAACGPVGRRPGSIRDRGYGQF